MERVVKGTVLGYLLPVLITALTHDSQQKLPQVLSLMPRLVQLVILTSQVSVLLSKGTILGYLLTHDSQQKLPQVLSLMPRLVQLVILTSQVSVLYLREQFYCLS